MRTERFLFELSGEHPSLPHAEVLAVVRTESELFAHVRSAPGIVVMEFESSRLRDVTGRLGLTHRAGRYLGSCSIEEMEEFLSSLSIPSGSIAIRARRVQGNMMSVSPSSVSRRVGAKLAKGRKVDLENPDHEIRVLISEGLHFFLSEVEIDRAQFESRKVGMRPFFSPISLHPRLARALINLTGVRRGERLLDPFCGTGGILIEASLMGIKVLGSDISEEMVRGCQENLEHFGADFMRLERVDVGNIADVFGKVDAIATDPPYGRSTTTMRERVEHLYSRMMGSFANTLRPGGKLGLVLPRECDLDAQPLRLEQHHVQRVHRSLTRNYCIFSREPEP